MVNNFKELEQRRVEKTKNEMEDLNMGIKNGIDGQVNLFKSIGRMLELYVPQMIGFIVSILGGEDSNKKQK